MPDQGTIKFCWDKEFYAFGTNYLFDWQAISLRGQLKLLSWSALTLRMLCASSERLEGLKKIDAVEGARHNLERLNNYLTSGR